MIFFLDMLYAMDTKPTATFDHENISDEISKLPSAVDYDSHTDSDNHTDEELLNETAYLLGMLLETPLL